MYIYLYSETNVVVSQTETVGGINNKHTHTLWRNEWNAVPIKTCVEYMVAEVIVFLSSGRHRAGEE